ncbi:MAG: hypothetical protein AAFQ82_01345 [Myxococcota bacterium]
MARLRSSLVYFIRRAPILLAFALAVLLSQDAHAQIFEPVDPVIDGNVSDQDHAFPDRPLTLKQGQVEASAHLTYIRFSSGGFSFDSAATLLNGSFGVTEDLELGLASYIQIDPDFEWAETLAARGVFNFLKGEADGSPLELAFDAQLVLNFAENADLIPFAVLGAPLRYKINDTMYILAGQNALTLGLEASILNLAANATFVWLPPVDNLTVRIDTQFFNLALRDGSSTFILVDTLPIALTAIYQILPLLDATVGLTLADATEGTDVLFFTGGILSRF